MKVICKNKISKKELFGGQITDNAWNQDIP